MAEPLQLPQSPNYSSSQEPVSIDTGQVPNPITDETADTRATKAYWGVGHILGKDKDEIKAHLQAGKEKDLREEAATKIDAMTYEKSRMDFLQKLASGRASVEELNQLQSMPDRPRTDPDTVFEQSYAKNYINAIDKLNLTPADPEASTQTPDQSVINASNVLRRVGETAVAQREWLATEQENVEARARQESTAGKFIDFMKGLIPFYDEYELRGLTEKQGWSNNLLGTALKQEAQEVLSLPLPEAKAKLKSILDSMSSNPELQVTFMSYMVGKSTDDERLDNIFSILNFAGSAALTKDIAKGSLSLIRRLTGNAKTAVAATKLVPEVSPQTAVAVAQGNNKEAAVQQAAETFIADTKGTIDPLKRALESMPTFLRRDAKARKADPGNFGTDLWNRMDEADKSAEEGLKEQILETARMNRVPELTVAKEHWNKAAEEVVASNPGVSGHVMNIKGPIWDPVGASWFLGRILGRTKGEYFGSMGEARELARSKDIPLSGPTSKIVKKTIPGTTREVAMSETGYQYGAEIRHISELGLQGDGWYITDLLPVSETTPTIRDLLGQSARATTPLDWTGGYIDATVGWLLRSPDETQSLDQQIARKVATFGMSNYLAFFRQQIYDLKRISPSSSFYGLFHKKQWKEFEGVLRYAQSALDPTTKEKGWFFETPGQLSNHYFTAYNRLPSEREVAAYFTFKRLVEMDRWFRTMAVVRNKQRIGVQSHTAVLEGRDGLVKIPFEGVRLATPELPQGEDTVLFLKRDPNHTRMYPGNAMPQKFREEANKDLKEGRAHIFEVFDTEERPFSKFTGRVRGRLNKEVDVGQAKVRYVFARRAETKPLDLVTQVPRRFGGHLVPDYEYVIAQPNMKFDPITNTWHYEGDNHAFFVKNHALGQDYAKRLNQHQDLLKAGREDEALEYARDNLHVDAKEHHANYKSKVAPGGEKLPPRWNLQDPFQVKKVGTNIIDTGKSALEDRYTKIKNGKLISKFRDGTRSGNLARTSLVEFTQHRDAYDLLHVNNTGTASNPVYHVEPASLIDPLPMLMRGLNRIVHSLQMDDYKIQAMEHWLFGKHILNPETGQMVGAADFMKDPRDLIEHSPFHYWNNLEWKAGFKTKMAKEWAMLTGDKMKIDMFTGVPNSVDGVLHSMEQSVANGIYKSDILKKLSETEWKMGNKTLPIGDYIVPTWMIGKISDGPRFLRNMLYGAKMGFGAPRQFFLHFVTTANAYLIDPQHAFHGSLGALLHGFSAFNSKPEILQALDRVASASGLYKPGDWLAFRKGLIDSGFIKVESGMHALRDSPLSTQILRNRWQTLMHAGTSPFRAGVTGVKTISWYMAAAGWRNGKLGRLHSGSRWSAMNVSGVPVGAPTKVHFGDILNRADDLAHNMSRASTSQIQKGMTSFGSQFTGFNQRVLELLAGKRLTVPEKIRLFFGYAGLYGVPAAGGIYGLSTYIRRLMNGKSPTTNQPYVPGANMLDTLIMEGYIATAIYKGPLLSGGGTGHLPNVGESFGAKDLNIVDDALNTDATWYDMWGGAALHGITNTAESLTPFITWADTLLNDNDERFRLTPQHFISVFKEISVVNYAWRAYMGATTHRWLSRNFSYLNDTSATNAILQNFFGTADIQTADIYNKSKEIENWRHMETTAIKHMSQEITMELLAASDKNWDEAKLHHMNAKVYMQGIPEQNQARIMTRIYNDAYIPLKDKVDLEYYLGRDRPDAKRDAGMKAWQDILQMNKKAKGTQ